MGGPMTAGATPAGAAARGAARQFRRLQRDDLLQFRREEREHQHGRQRRAHTSGQRMGELAHHPMMNTAYQYNFLSQTQCAWSTLPLT